MQLMNNRALFLQHLAQTSPSPLLLEIASANGVWMYEPDQTPVLDFISGIGVSALGHCHPSVVKAVQEQAERFMHLMVYGEVVHAPQNELATALLSTFSEAEQLKLNSFYFTNSGSEAVEGAIKLARRSTGRPELIACHNAYHGGTTGALAIGGGSYFMEGYYPLTPGTRRGIFGSQQLIDQICQQTAAVIVETIQGEAGIRTACKSWWQALRKRCDETGTLLILDEIQAGMGRTGKWWAFQQLDIVPDILLSAKGLGGGMPIGMFAASRELMANLSDTPVLGHITTFGGHPVSCVAATATIRALQSESYICQVSLKTDRLISAFRQMPHVTEVRHAGFLMAVELGSYDKVRYVIDFCLAQSDYKLLTDWFLYCDTAFRVAPPLIITDTELDQAIDIIGRALIKLE